MQEAGHLVFDAFLDAGVKFFEVLIKQAGFRSGGWEYNINNGERSDGSADYSKG